MPHGKSARLAALRRRVTTLERRTAVLGERRPAWRLALEPFDSALPQDGLATDGVHEAAGRREDDAAAAAVFLSALLRRIGRRDGRETVLVCQGPAATRRLGRFYAPGWRALGHGPERFVIACPVQDGDVPWIVEQGLRSACLAAVVAETAGIGFTASRRLSLAAREGHTPALLLRLDGIDAASAAATRWRVASLPGAPEAADAFGVSRWRLDLKRCRGGRPRSRDVEWDHETGDFHMVAALARRPAEPGQTPARRAG